MKLAIDRLAQRLAASLGGHSVSTDASVCGSRTIDGRQPTLVCRPETADQVAAGLRLCSEAGATVIPYGGGTAISIGNAARHIDVIMDLKRFNRVIEHDDANLTTTVEAGITLTRLEEFVARNKQFVPFDPPHPERATVGGIIATNLNGPRRSYYGSVRDLVIGMKVVLASGEQIKAGGKVVKNVAGYDMCKLFVGSLGTLGIITQVTLRTSPLPETAATLTAAGTAMQVFNLADHIAHSPLLPAAVVILSPLACQEMNTDGANWKLAVWSEGFGETVARHMRDAKAMAEGVGLGADLLQNSLHGQFWAGIRDFPLPSDRLVFRLTVPRASIADAITTIENWQADECRPAIVADAVAGTAWIAAPPSQPAANQFPKLVALAREQRGHVAMLVAPLELKQSVDVWGSPPPALALMRKIKEQFDPLGLLNPGRYVSAI
jgi:glycolate oxidase FAD binding subunit